MRLACNAFELQKFDVSNETIDASCGSMRRVLTGDAHRILCRLCFVESVVRFVQNLICETGLISTGDADRNRNMKPGIPLRT